MRRLWRWTGGSTTGRRVLLTMAVVAMWIAWAVIPASPAVSWSCAAGEPDGFELTPDGGTIVHTAGLSYGEIVSMPSFMSRYIHLPSRICDAVTGRQRFELFTHEGMGARIAGFAPDGSWLFVDQEADNTARLLDATDGRELARFPGETHWAWWIKRSPDGRELAMVPPRGSEVRLWDIATRRVRLVLPEARQVAAYSPDGRRLATGWWDHPEEWASPDRRRTLRIRDVATGHELARRDFPVVASVNFEFSPDGRWLATLSESLRPNKNRDVSMHFEPFAPETSVPGTLTLWDVNTDTLTKLVEFQDASRIGGIAFSPDGRCLALRARNGPQFWDLSASPPALWSVHTPLNSASDRYPYFIPRTDRIVFSDDDPTILNMWSTADKNRRQAVCRLRAADLSPNYTTTADGSTLAVLLRGYTPIHLRVAELLKHVGIQITLHRQCLVQLFDTETGAERSVFDQEREAQLLGFSPDGAMLWTSAFVPESADGHGVATIRGWAVKSPGPPIWLLAATAVGIIALVLDWHRSRRRAAKVTPA